MNVAEAFVSGTSPYWVGVDPGGKNAFGVAVVSSDGVVGTGCVS